MFLLDVNILIALLDGNHMHHRMAKEWFLAHSKLGWATSALTELGCIRIMSSRSYAEGGFTPVEVADGLERIKTLGHWSFSEQGARPTDPSIYDLRKLASPSQITDAYLLGLCKSTGYRLATLDRRLTAQAIIDPPADLIEYV